jgi:octaprenyl-diphosphate synthase
MLSTKQTSTVSSDASPLDALQRILKDDVEGLNKTILARMESPVPLINQLASYIIASGGKRLRPTLTLAFARALNYKGLGHLNLAAAVEFIHTATLLHDDVVDESTLRRGQPAANEIFGNQASVLVGDFLFSRAFRLMVETDNLNVLKVLSDASAIIAQGEVMQLIFTGDLSITREKYFEVVGAKTAALFAAACQVGAEIADANPSLVQAAYQFGYHLGIAFQIVDDVLDYQGQTKSLGKNVGDDFKEGKLTLPVIIALERALPYERDFWKRTMVDLDQSDGDLDYAQNILKSHQSLEIATTLAQEQIRKAREFLMIFPKNVIIDLVDKTALYAVSRHK